MNSQAFVIGVRDGVVNTNLAVYENMFANAVPEKATDPYGRAAIQFYRNLDKASREILLRIMRQVMVDTISSLLAILDGAIRLPGQKGRFVLELSGERLEGTLQDQFLELEEIQSS